MTAIRQARDRLARRVRVPLWYAGVYTLTMLVVLITLGVFYAADRVLLAAVGFDVSLNLVRRFRSLRVATPLFLRVVAGSSAVVWLARAQPPTRWAIVVALTGAAACAVARFAPLVGIRADVRAGRGVDAG